jgi:hypothetical protein
VTFTRPDFGLAARRVAVVFDFVAFLFGFFFGMHKYLW